MSPEDLTYLWWFFAPGAESGLTHLMHLILGINSYHGVRFDACCLLLYSIVDVGNFGFNIRAVSDSYWAPVDPKGCTICMN